MTHYSKINVEDGNSRGALNSLENLRVNKTNCFHKAMFKTKNKMLEFTPSVLPFEAS